MIGLVLLFLRPRPRTALIYLLTGVVSIAGYQLALLTADPALGDADCIVETESGRADGRIETQLLALRQALRNAETDDD